MNTENTLSPFAAKLLAALLKLSKERVPHPCGGFTTDDMQWQMGVAFTPDEMLYEALDELTHARLIRLAGYDEADAIETCYEPTNQNMSDKKPNKPKIPGEDLKGTAHVEAFGQTFPAKISKIPEHPTNPAGEEIARVPLGDFRTLKATVPSEEFGAIQWAAKRAGQGGRPQPMADFLRGALLERVREIVRGEIEGGKAIPPDIAAIIDDRRNPK